jgi:hypothetical protein
MTNCNRLNAIIAKLLYMLILVGIWNTRIRIGIYMALSLFSLAGKIILKFKCQTPHSSLLILDTF